MTLSEPPIETLRRFVYLVDQLQTRKLIQDEDLRSSLTLNAEANQPLMISHHEPDEEHLRSYLLDFRKFISPSEEVHLYKIFNVAWRHITSEDMAHYLVEARQSWKTSMSSGEIAFIVNDNALEPEDLIDLWINGYYFHNDAHKAARLKALWRVPMTRWLFINVLVKATRVLLYTAHAIKIALREGLVSEVPVRGS